LSDSPPVPQLQEFAEPRFEDARHFARLPAFGGHLLVHGIDVAAAPELAFKTVGFAQGALEGKHLDENEPPRHQRRAQQQQHDELHG
jgi:hypothetical protein